MSRGQIRSTGHGRVPESTLHSPRTACSHAERHEIFATQNHLEEQSHPEQDLPLASCATPYLDRRLRHGLQNHTSPCSVCGQEEDAKEHILIQCIFARGVWQKCCRALCIATQIPMPNNMLEEWWLRERRRISKLCTTCCALWKDMNTWASRTHSITQLSTPILAGFKMIIPSTGVRVGVPTQVVRS
jgi:hypothetical protein